jgi:hypothetical protein
VSDSPTDGLEPCPFCGGRLREVVPDPYVPHVPGDATHVHPPADCPLGGKEFWPRTLEYWNNRPPRMSDVKIGEFVARWEEAADGVCMDADTAQALAREVRLMRETLEFYADPENYHAISFMCDRPCGLFAEDFDEEHGHEDYDRPMPGSRARRALGRE